MFQFLAKKRRTIRQPVSRRTVLGTQIGLETLETRNLLTTFVVEAGASVGGTGTPQEPFALIQQAIDAAKASPGDDLVFVREGTYLENLRVTDAESLTVQGEGHVVIHAANDSSDVLDINGKGNVTLRNLHLVGGDRGIDARGAFEADFVLEHVTVHAPDSDALRVRQAGDLTIVHSAFVNSIGADGLDIEDLGAVTIIGSTVTGHADTGIEIDNASSVRIINSSATGNGEEGVSIDGSLAATIVGSSFVGNGEDGLDIDDTQVIRITNIVSTDNRGSGVQIEAGDNATESTIREVSIVNSVLNDNDEYGMEIVENLGGNVIEQVDLTNVDLIGNDLGALAIIVSGEVRKRNVRTG